MFAKLAKVITEHYKKIIILWILLLVPALFFAPQVGSVLVYEETAIEAPDLPSTWAQEFIERKFDPGSGDAGSSTIIVLQDSNILDDESKQVVFRIERGIGDKVDAGKLPENTSLTTIYGVVEEYGTQLLMSVHSAYHLANESIQFSSLLLFGLPEGYRALWEESNLSAFVVFGVPHVHVSTWTAIRDANPGWTVPQVDSVAYNATFPAIFSSPMYQALEDQRKGMSIGWYQAYAMAWNATAGVPALAAFPNERSKVAIDAAFPAFVSSLPISPAEAAFLLGVQGGLDQYTWSDFHALSALSFAFFQDMVGEMIGTVGPEQRQIVDLYMELFYGSWNASVALPTELQYRAIVGSSAHTLASTLGGLEGELLLAVHLELGWENWQNISAMKQLAVALVSQETGAEAWLVHELSALPKDASFVQFVIFSKRLVADYPLDAFPIPLVPGLVGLFVNVPTNDTMLMTIGYGKDESGTKYVTEIRGVVQQVTEGEALDYYVTGNDPISYDMETSTNQDIERIDPVTILLVLVLIGFFFRSLVASSVPPLVIGVALGLSFTIVFLLGTYFLSVHYSVLPLLVTSSLGAGCDYCIFILSRYREERRKGNAKEEAVHTAVTWAGESITTSGLTVIIGFGVLSLGSFWVIQSMGVALALGITIALLASLTLLPSVLMLLGDRIFWPAKVGVAGPKRRVKDGYFVRAAKASIKHAKLILVAAVLISVPTTYLALTMETSYDFIAAMPDVESKQGLSAMEQGFGAGKITPTQIALSMSEPVFANGSFSVAMLNSIGNVSREMASLENVQSVTSPTQPLGTPIDYRNLSSYPPLELENLKATMRSMLGTNDTSAVLITVVFKQEPFSNPSINSIQIMRQGLADLNDQDPDIMEGYVGGATAQMFDISNLMSREFSNMELLVIIGIYIVLMVVIGSIISPLRSILTILLSISWTLAATMLVFELTRDIAILWLLPTILLVICLGLGMDYDIFITTRIREEVARGRETNDAIVHAMENTGGVITACGIIMASAFGTLMLSSGAMLQEFGFALAFAILLDAMVVRIYLVPAIVSLLGKWNWYAPGRLQRTGRTKSPKKR